MFKTLGLGWKIIHIFLRVPEFAAHFIVKSNPHACGCGMLPKYSRGIRQRLQSIATSEGWRERHEIHIDGYGEDADIPYTELLASSIFCVAVPGEGLSHMTLLPMSLGLSCTVAALWRNPSCQSFLLPQGLHSGRRMAHGAFLIVQFCHRIYKAWMLWAFVLWDL